MRTMIFVAVTVASFGLIPATASAEPGWTPTLPMADPSAGYRTTDMLTLAGVDPVSRGQ